MTSAGDALCLALDVADVEQAVSWVERTRDAVGTYKVGLQLYTAEGPAVVDRLRRAGARRIFLDLKLHDIPNTVAGAVRAAAALGVDELTVHVGGGRAMLESAQAAAGPVLLLGVTVLTSLDAAALFEIGEGSLAPADLVLRRARLAAACGLGGLVCSPAEVAAVRDAVGPALRLVTPGIRCPGDPVGDQRRTATATEARRAGADVLVVGRSITSSPDPGARLRALTTEIESVHDGR